jgi:hypothetical protein
LLTSTECRFKSEDEQNDKKNLLKWIFSNCYAFVKKGI